MNELTRWRGEAGAPLPSYGGAGWAAPSFRDPDIGALFRALLSNFRLIAVIIALGAVIAFFVLRAMPPQFTASTLIMLDARSTLLDETQGAFSTSPIADTYIESEIELIRSDAIVHRVIEREGLLGDPEFAGKSIPAGVRLMAERRAGDEAGRREAAELLAGVRLLQVAGEVRKRLEVSRRGLSQGVVISFRSKSQVKSRDVANAFAHIYVDDQLGHKQQATRRATEWLREELRQLAAETQEAEAAVEAYRARNTLVGEGETGVSTQQLRLLSTELASARARASAARVAVDQLQRLRDSGRSLLLLAEISEKPTIVDLRQKLNDADNEINELSNRYNPERWESIPPFVEARSRRSALQASLNEETARAVEEIEARLATAQAEARSLENELSRLRGDSADVNAASVGLNELERAAEGKRRRYESLLADYNKADSNAAAQTPHARIVSPAALPLTPSAPRKKAAFAAAVIFSAALGVFAALLKEFSRRALRTPEEVHALTGARPVGVIPAQSTRKKPVAAAMNAVVKAPNAPYAEAVRSLRAELSLGGAGDPGEVIVVTAPDAVAGQAAVAAALARSLAMAERRTLLVDADLRRAEILPQLFRREEDGRDFADALRDGDWRERLTMTRNPHLAILAAKKGGWCEQVSMGFSGRFRDFIEQWKSEFDTIIVNAPPVLTFPEARVVAALADDVLLAVEWNRTDRRRIVEAMELLSEVEREPRAVLTQVEPHAYRRMLGSAAAYFSPPQLRVVNA